LKELAESHIGHVTQQELGVDVSIESGPIVINEVVARHRDIHGRCMAFLYCRVLHHHWRWRSTCQEVAWPGMVSGCGTIAVRTIDTGIVQHEMDGPYLDGTSMA